MRVAKYRVGDKVTLLKTRGTIMLAFLYKQFAIPDQQHYNVKLDDGTILEVNEEELS